MQERAQNFPNLSLEKDDQEKEKEGPDKTTEKTIEPFNQPGDEEFKEWCEEKLTNYYNYWKSVMDGKYKSRIWGGAERPTENIKQRKEFVNFEIDRMRKEIAANFFHGQAPKENEQVLIAEKLDLIAEKLETFEIVDTEGEVNEEVEIPDWLRL